MTTFADWFTFDSKKRAQRVRSFPLSHVLKELLSNSLDAEAPTIELTCSLAEGSRANRSGNRLYQVDCMDDGRGCDSPQVLRSVGSTTNDDAPTKRGRFGQGLIDVIAIADEAEILTLRHRLTFDTKGCRITSTKTSVSGLHFSAKIRHPGDDTDSLSTYFNTVIVPEGVKLVFNGQVVPRRTYFRVVPGITLAVPIFDSSTETIKLRKRSTELRILPKAKARLPATQALPYIP